MSASAETAQWHTMDEITNDAGPRIEAKVLGRLRLLVSGREIEPGEWPSRPARLLTVRLLLAAGRAVSRARLVDDLWPHLDADAGRNSLSKALNGARAVLEPGRARRESGQFLTADREWITWNPDVVISTDAGRFENAVRAAAALPVQQRRSGLNDALSLYQGDLLDEEPGAEWAEGRRFALRAMWRQAVLDLVALDHAEGATTVSFPLVEKLVAADPADEEAHRAIMRAYLIAGQPERALLSYRICADALMRELGVAPGSKTKVFLTEILSEQSGAAQTVVPGRPPDRRRVRAPVPATPLIGRDNELGELEDLLAQRGVRLVTLTGPGGVGKTRLVLELARRLGPDFAQGACFVDLAAVRQPDLVLPAIAQTLGIHESRRRPLSETVCDALIDEEMLLIFDNFEHVVESAAIVAELLATSEGIMALATSREPLLLRAEHTYSVPPLAIPNPERLPRLPALGSVESVALFLARARQVSPGFELTEENAGSVAGICAWLDGLPLAIELAASQVRDQSPESVLAGLTNRLSGLARGYRDLPDRHRTMRDAIAWSYELLDDAGQACFRRLSVFTGSISLVAAEHVWDTVSPRTQKPGQPAGTANPPLTELVASLAEKSLIHLRIDGIDRCALLETIREYGLERLAVSGEALATRQAHASWFAALAGAAAAELYGPDQIDWLDRLDADRANLNAALAWSIEQTDSATATRLATALWRFWLAKSAFAEGVAWIERVLVLESDIATADRAELSYAAGSLLNRMGNYETARQRHAAALRLWKAMSDRRGEARALVALAALKRREGDFDQAREILAKAMSLASHEGYDAGVASALNHLGLTATMQGRLDEAEEYFSESLTLHQDLGDRYGESIVLNNLGEIASEHQDLETAANYYEASLRIAREMDSRDGTAAELANLAGVRLQMGDIERARALAAEAVETLRAIAGVDYLPQALGMLGEAQRMAGDLVHAQESFQEALALNQRLGDQSQVAACMEALAGIKEALAAQAAG